LGEKGRGEIGFGREKNEIPDQWKRAKCAVRSRGNSWVARFLEIINFKDRKRLGWQVKLRRRETKTLAT